MEQPSADADGGGSRPGPERDGLRGVFHNRPDARRSFLETPSTIRRRENQAATSAPVPPPEAVAPMGAVSPDPAAAEAMSPPASGRTANEERRPFGADSINVHPPTPVPRLPWGHRHVDPDRSRPLETTADCRVSEERRLSHRYTGGRVRIRVGWGGEDTPDGEPPARLQVEHIAEVEDISQTGISLLCAHVPPGNRAIWVAAAGPVVAAWTRVVLRSLSEPEFGRFLLRFAFTEGCPYDLFRIAVIRSTTEASLARTDTISRPE